MTRETGLPQRLTTAEVCALARYSRATLWRRVRSGKAPAPVDRGRQALFDRDAVLSALDPAKPLTGRVSDEALARRIGELAARRADRRARKAN